MGWRGHLIKYIGALVGTVLAGVIVWFLTVRESDEVKGESIRYRVDEVATFPLGGTKVGFSVVKVVNAGSAAARQVRIVVMFPDSVEIREKQIQFGNGLDAEFVETETDAHTLDITLPSLVRGELLHISMLLSGVSEFSPRVVVRSAESTGMEGASDSQDQTAYRSFFPLILLAVVQAGFVWALFFWRKSPLFFPRMMSLFPSANSTAFLYLQRKLTQEAQELLAQRIGTRGGDVLTVANYGLALGLNGDVDGAEKRFEIADWWAAGKHERAVVQFNRATLMIHLGELGLARGHLAKAFSLSRRAISNYCTISAYMDDAAEKDGVIREIIESKGGSFQAEI